MRLCDLTDSSGFGGSGEQRRADLFPARNLPSYYGAYAAIQQEKGLITAINLVCNALPTTDDFFNICRLLYSTLSKAT